MKALMAWRERSFLTEGRIDVLSVFRYFLTRVVVYVGMCVCVLLCFIEPIVGNNEPGGLNRGQRIQVCVALFY